MKWFQLRRPTTKCIWDASFVKMKLKESSVMRTSAIANLKFKKNYALSN